MKTQLIKIEELFNQQLESGAKIIKHSNDYEVIEPVSECQILVVVIGFHQQNRGNDKLPMLSF